LKLTRPIKSFSALLMDAAPTTAAAPEKEIPRGKPVSGRIWKKTEVKCGICPLESLLVSACNERKRWNTVAHRLQQASILHDGREVLEETLGFPPRRAQRAANDEGICTGAQGASPREAQGQSRVDRHVRAAGIAPLHFTRLPIVLCLLDSLLKSRKRMLVDWLACVRSVSQNLGSV
jgi:hypothetical protein